MKMRFLITFLAVFSVPTGHAKMDTFVALATEYCDYMGPFFSREYRGFWCLREKDTDFVLVLKGERVLLLTRSGGLVTYYPDGVEPFLYKRLVSANNDKKLEVRGVKIKEKQHWLKLIKQD